MGGPLHTGRAHTGEEGTGSYKPQAGHITACRTADLLLTASCHPRLRSATAHMGLKTVLPGHAFCMSSAGAHLFHQTSQPTPPVCFRQSLGQFWAHGHSVSLGRGVLPTAVLVYYYTTWSLTDSRSSPEHLVVTTHALLPYGRLGIPALRPLPQTSPRGLPLTRQLTPLLCCCPC